MNFLPRTRNETNSSHSRALRCQCVVVYREEPRPKFRTRLREAKELPRSENSANSSVGGCVRAENVLLFCFRSDSPRFLNDWLATLVFMSSAVVTAGAVKRRVASAGSVGPVVSASEAPKYFVASELLRQLAGVVVVPAAAAASSASMLRLAGDSRKLGEQREIDVRER